MSTNPPEHSTHFSPNSKPDSPEANAGPTIAPSPDHSTPPELDGTWERRHRSPVSAAVVGMLLVGLLYMFGQLLLIVPSLFGLLLDSGAAGDGAKEYDTSQIIVQLRTPILVAVTLSQYLFMALPAWWLVRRWHVGASGSVARYVRLRRADWRVALLTPLLTLAFIPPANFLSQVVMEWFGMTEDPMKELEVLFTAHSFPELLLLGFVIAVTPAICEEIFFRGYVQRTFERGIGERSIWVTGVLFGLFHFQPLGLPTLALMGILLGYLYHRTQSLIPSMIAHFTNNFAVVLFLYLAQSDPQFAAESESFSMEVVLISGVLCLLLLAVVHRVTGLERKLE